MKLNKPQRSPERIIKLYDWLWDRARDGKRAPFYLLKPQSLTGRCLMMLAPQIADIKRAMQSRAYRDAVSVIIHSN